MIQEKNLIALGRSKYLFDAIKHLYNVGYQFKAIISEEGYDEYEIQLDDFKKLASELNIPFFTTKSLDNPEIREIILTHKIRAAISANWQFKIQKNVLDLFEFGIFNYHLGNLPDYKGNATVNWTIINNENHIYGNIHKMDAILDAGDVISRKIIPINNHTYISDIIKQAEADAPLLYEIALNRIFDNPSGYEIKGSIKGLRCYPRLPEDSQINWNESNENIHRLIRASSHPYKGAYSYLNGNKIIIWKSQLHDTQEDFLAIPGHIVEINKKNGSILVACQNNLIEIQEIELAGKIIPPTEICKSIRERFKFKTND